MPDNLMGAIGKAIAAAVNVKGLGEQRSVTFKQGDYTGQVVASRDSRLGVVVVFVPLPAAMRAAKAARTNGGKH